MEYDFGVMMSTVEEGKVLALEIGIKNNGKPIYRVSVFNGETWTGACYHSFKSAHTTYKLLERVI